GAGYANQMASVPLMKDIIVSSKQMLEEAKRRNTKDLLLDKFTLRYLTYIDIDAALAWIQEEDESQGVLPEQVAFVSNKSTETDIVSLQRAFSASSSESVIFVNNNYDVWNYDDEEHGWRSQFLNHFNTHDGMVSLCVVDTTKCVMPEPALNMLRSVKSGWAKEVKHIASPYTDKDIYPIAYIDGVLYLTNNVEYSGLNDAWGNMTLFCARVDDISAHAVGIDCGFNENTKIFLFSGDDALSIKSNELGHYIQDHSVGIIDRFIHYCQSQGGKIKVSYQDEHLKSVMGMLITLQTIQHIIKQIGADFELKFLMEKYEDDYCKYMIQSNLKNSVDRDRRLTDLTSGWIYDLNNEYSIHGNLIPISSYERNSLTHWRVLSFVCGDKKLSIYPDGGFANGWNIGKNSKFFTLDNTDSRDFIVIERCKDIKYDVTVSDNN
nr:DEAD/DEAH box helicase [Prevotella sp.]